MTYDQWVQTYRPIRVADRKPSQTGDYPECELSPSAGHVVLRILPRNVWTMVEGDDGESWYIVPGYHIVNRIGHVETVEAWTDADCAMCVPYMDASDMDDVPFDGTGTAGDGDA